MGKWQISGVRVTVSIKWSSQVGSSRLKNGQVASRYASIHYKSQIFNVKYNAIIEIVECELCQVAQKWSSASRICEYAGTCPFPICKPTSEMQYVQQWLTG